ncbi:MAG: DUF1376 domain-containing protein [Brevundimonas sp.]|nr:MAG: DUF1376 domain-containing protein [Brevundimonas sp.]
MSAPYMQLYVADYLGDTRHLTTEQHGAYMLLLMTMWRSGGVIPNDDAKLARITGLTVARWKRISADVLAFFDVCEGGLTQARLAAELAIHEEKSEKRSQAGKAGGRAKALKDKKAGLANTMPMPCHSPEPEPDTDTSVSDARAAPVRSSGDFERFWSAYPAKVGKKAALKAWRAAKDRPALPVVLAALDRYCRTKPADREWCNPATWINQGRWDDEEAQTGAAVTSLPAATFDGPADLRAAVVRLRDEDYARRWLDHYCRWRKEDRTLLARSEVVASTLRRDLAEYLAEKKIRVEVAPANDTPAISHGEAA